MYMLKCALQHFWGEIGRQHITPLSPNINMHVLLSVRYIFLVVLVGVLRLNIKIFYLW